MDADIRKLVIQIIIISVVFIYLTRLFYIQVIDRTSASEIRKKEVRAPRGLIKDRNGLVVVANQPMYDLMLIAKDLKAFDTLLFCDLIGMDKSNFLEKIDRAKKLPYKPFLFKRQLDFREYAIVQEEIHEFPGFYSVSQTKRVYPFRSAAHVLGYVGKVDSSEILEFKGVYNDQDFIGKTGLESTYETYLKGEKGEEWLLYDVHNRVKGKYNSGEKDKLPMPGFNLITSLDIELQNYGEALMKNKRGSVVAIEPSSGEILAFISSPTYDPSVMVGGKRGEMFDKLKKDTLKPLFNRPVMAMYPPGSTFKTIMSLIGLEEEAIKSKTKYKCNGLSKIPGIVTCHDHDKVKGVRDAIRFSCNNYYSFLMKDHFALEKFTNASKAYDNWFEYASSFGLGKKLTQEFPFESKGNLPKKGYYDKLYGKGRWKAPTIISLSVGQGELLMTPIQIANVFSAIANRGYYIKPHLVKWLELENGTKKIDFDTVKIPIKDRYFEKVVLGLEDVVQKGTARRSKIKSIDMCGKTGTAENPHGEDHSVFAAFAPKEQAKIAIAVFVENSGFGSTWAAPIASLMIEKYLNKTIEGKQRKYLEKTMLEGNLIE